MPTVGCWSITRPSVLVSNLVDRFAVDLYINLVIR